MIGDPVDSHQIRAVVAGEQAIATEIEFAAMPTSSSATPMRPKEDSNILFHRSSASKLNRAFRIGGWQTPDNL